MNNEMLNIPVELQPLAEFWNINLHEFEPGKTYPLSALFAALGLAKGTPKGTPKGNTK
jgi:hypothetical protein